MRILKFNVMALLALLLMSAACAPAAPPPATSAAAQAPTTPPSAAPSTAAAKPASSPSAAPASPVGVNSPLPSASPALAASPSPLAVPAPAAQPSGPPATGDVTVFAAASLTDVFNAMATSFQQANPDAHLTFNFASSGTLVNQLNQGARADAFAAADQNTMNNAKNGGALTGPGQVFARNSLIVIVPTANPVHVTGLKDLANPGLKVVTADTSVSMAIANAPLVAVQVSAGGQLCPHRWPTKVPGTGGCE